MKPLLPAADGEVDVVSTWMDLPEPWQAAFEQAWTAYRHGSLPIGSAITDDAGVVVTRGRNRLGEERRVDGVISGHDLAHAEINALLTLPPAERPRVYAFTLYTTIEPCPQCLGALVMSGVRGLSYAARDAWAGCADLLTSHAYMRGKNLRLKTAPPPLPEVCGALLLAALHEDGRTMRPDSPLAARFRAKLPKVVGVAERLHEIRALPHLRERQVTACEVFGQLMSTLTSFVKEDSRPTA